MTEVDAAEVKRAVLVNIDFNTPRFDEELDEFVQLVESTGLTPEIVFGGHRDRPDARLFIGKGKVAEIADFISANDIDLVIFNHELTPAQERNLEKELKCRVLDRVGLILDILPSGPEAMRVSCRLNWPSCNTFPHGWSGGGPTLRGRKVVLD